MSATCHFTLNLASRTIGGLCAAGLSVSIVPCHTGSLSEPRSVRTWLTLIQKCQTSFSRPQSQILAVATMRCVCCTPVAAQQSQLLCYPYSAPIVLVARGTRRQQGTPQSIYHSLTRCWHRLAVQVTFTPEISATYGLSIMLQGVPLQGSPFKIWVRNDETIASNCRYCTAGAMTAHRVDCRNKCCTAESG